MGTGSDALHALRIMDPIANTPSSLVMRININDNHVSTGRGYLNVYQDNLIMIDT